MGQCIHLGHVEFVVLYRTVRERCLASVWNERSDAQKKYRIVKSQRKSKELFYVLKTLKAIY